MDWHKDIDMARLRTETREVVDLIISAASVGHLVTMLGQNKVTGERVVILGIARPGSTEPVDEAVSRAAEAVRKEPGALVDFDLINSAVIPVAELLIEVPVLGPGANDNVGTDGEAS